MEDMNVLNLLGMGEESGIPVYFINGLLESGKTEFINFTIEEDYFKIDELTLIIACEEGMEEYDEGKPVDDIVNDILEEYIQISSGDRNVLFKMKELWFYMIDLFEDAEKIAKKI